MSDGADNSTVRSELRPVLPGVPFLELRVRGANGSRPWPFLTNPLRFRLEDSSIPTEATEPQASWQNAPRGVSTDAPREASTNAPREATTDAPDGATTDAPEWTVELTPDHRLVFRSLQPDGPSHHCLLGQELQLDGYRVSVHDLRTLPPYRLVALSEELNSRTWPLSDGRHAIGRPGKRVNAVALASSSISRTHARLEIAQRSAHLVPEAEGALTAVNGRPIELGQAYELQPDDVLQLGDLLFRWEREERAFRPSTERLRLGSLGQISIGLGPRDQELEVRNDNARSLLFWLATLRGEELSLERVLETYWPERPLLRQRKNLSHALKALQAEVGWSDTTLEHLLPRSGDSLRLDPAALASFDVWSLREAARRHRDEPLGWSEILTLHRGPFLARQRAGWIGVVRLELFALWLSMLETSDPKALTPALKIDLGELLTRALRDGDFEEFVYERVFRLAAHLGLQERVPLWLGELRHRLATETGEAPSAELVRQAERLSFSAGRSESDRMSAATLEEPR